MEKHLERIHVGEKQEKDRAEDGCSLCFQNASATQFWDGGGPPLFKTAQPSPRSSSNNTKLFSVTVKTYPKIQRLSKLKAGWFVLELVTFAAVSVYSAKVGLFHILPFSNSHFLLL